MKVLGMWYRVDRHPKRYVLQPPFWKSGNWDITRVNNLAKAANKKRNQRDFKLGLCDSKAHITEVCCSAYC